MFGQLNWPNSAAGFFLTDSIAQPLMGIATMNRYRSAWAVLASTRVTELMVWGRGGYLCRSRHATHATLKASTTNPVDICIRYAKEKYNASPGLNWLKDRAKAKSSRVNPAIDQ